MDMPPGIGDAVLDLIRFVNRIEFVIVTTPSQLAFETVKKLSSLLHELNIPIIGVVENMKMDKADSIQRKTEERGLCFLGGIPFDMKLEEAIGDPTALLDTSVGYTIGEITKLIEK
jgi:ATP-binding protein involved in chromosome partitioning